MKEIAQVFSKLGLLGFGGPIATIAMMEEETSRKRGWITPERFAEIYSLCKILPGPVATQLAVYDGTSLAIGSDGHVRGWGRNGAGELGHDPGWQSNIAPFPPPGDEVCATFSDPTHATYCAPVPVKTSYSPLP